eukprot:7387295-Prymnesium_polylepis.2
MLVEEISDLLQAAVFGKVAQLQQHAAPLAPITFKVSTLIQHAQDRVIVRCINEQLVPGVRVILQAVA